MTSSQANGPRTRWGTGQPSNEDEARARLLDAAERVFAARGVARTRMGEVAAEAGVHRTTVYQYFESREALLAAAFVRAADAALTAAEPCFSTTEPFTEQLLDAMLISLDEARQHPMVMTLLAGDTAGTTIRAVHASKLWIDRAHLALGQHLIRAVARGELRADVPTATIERWIWRIAFSLAAQPADPEDGGDAGVLRAFLAPALTTEGHAP